MNTLGLDPTRVEQSIGRGIAYLRENQLATGELRAYRGTDAAMQGERKQDSSIFPTALAAQCLLFLEDRSEVDEILKRATDFFFAQRLEDGVWGHFTIGHALRRLCSPDVDDTSCVSAVLKARGLLGSMAGNIELLLANQNRAGLFHTWMVTRIPPRFNAAWWRLVLAEWKTPKRTIRYWRMNAPTRNGVDSVVNANVLFYLGNIAEVRRTADYLLRTIAAGNETPSDLWYQETNIVDYFFSRLFLRGFDQLEPGRQIMLDRIRASAREDGLLGGSVLETAMGVCALMNLGIMSADMSPWIEKLLQTQQADGAWPRQIIYWGGPDRKVGWGSEEVTTAYCLEALSRAITS